MRVLQITAYSGWGCTGRIAEGIHNALIKQNQEGTIAWGRVNTAAENVRTIKIGNKFDQNMHGLYTRITDKCGFASKIVTKNFLKELDEYNPDLIQLHIMHGYYIDLENLFKYIKKKNIPVVWTFHDCWAFTGHCPYFDLVHCEKWKTGCHHCQQKYHHPASLIIDNSTWNWNKKKELFTGIKNMTIVTPSKWLAELVKESIFKDYSIEIINNGINLGDFMSMKSDVREKYKLKNKKIVLGVSSSWSKSKGLDDFIQVAEKLPNEYQVILIGLSREKIKTLPDNILGIQRTDYLSELAAFYSEADVFVNPTYEDNYPTTNLEAIACGTPVVTYQTGGSVEIIEETGYGIVVEQGNIRELIKAIVTVRKEDIKGKYNHLLSQELRFAEYVELYRRILGE